MPWLASRPTFLAALARPRSLSSCSALPRSASASSMARLHSMMPAPVFSRSSLISSVVLAMRLRVLVFVQVELVHHEVFFGHHGQLGRHLFDLVLGQATLGQRLAHDRGARLATLDNRVGDLAGDQSH